MTSVIPITDIKIVVFFSNISDIAKGISSWISDTQN